MTGLEPMEGLIGRALGRLGVERFDLVLALYEEWEDVVPEPWRSHSRPVLLKERELSVEAAPAAVRLLRYATGDLLRVLDQRFGEGTVATVRVQAQRTGGRNPAGD